MTDTKRNSCPTEDTECIALAQYLAIKGIRFYSHIAQETPAGKYVGGRWQPNFKTIKRNKAVGVNKGVPDYIAIIEKQGQENSPYKTNVLVFIEMKREKGSTLSKEQSGWINALNKVPGVVAVVCRGFEAAKEIIDAMLIQVK